MTADLSTGARPGLSDISRLSGQILDIGLERSYRRTVWSEHARSIRVALVLGAAALLLSLVVDMLRVPDGAGTIWVVGSHIGAFAMCSIAFFLSFRMEPTPSLSWSQVGLAIAFSLASAIIILSGIVSWTDYAITEALAIVYFALVLPNWIPQIYWSIGVLLAGYFLAMPQVDFGVSTIQIVVTELLIAAAGLFVINRTIKRAKRGFLLREQLARSRNETLAELDETRFQREAFEETAAESVGVMEEIEFMRQDMEQQAIFLTTVLDNISQGVSVFDRDFGLAAWNKGFGELLELPETMLVPGLSLKDVVVHNIKGTGLEGADLVKGVEDTITQFVNTAEGDHETTLFERNRSDGTVFEVKGNAMPGGGIVITYTDITEQKKTEAAIRQMAETDALTGLANRAAFDGALAHAMAATVEASGSEKSRLALAILDLDGFKPVNDRFGHPVGDEVLRRVAETIKESVRDTDIAARLGGDEFAIIFQKISRVRDAQAPLQRLIEKLENPITIDGRDIRIGISAGLACFPEGAENQNDLIKCADDALYEAKRAGKGRLSLAAG